MPTTIRMSPELRDRIKKNAYSEEMTITDWVIASIEKVLKARKFEGLVDIKCVAEILSEHSDRQQLNMDDKFLERIDRAAQRRKMTRSDFIFMSILHADRKFLSRHDTSKRPEDFA